MLIGFFTAGQRLYGKLHFHFDANQTHSFGALRADTHTRTHRNQIEKIMS